MALSLDDIRRLFQQNPQAGSVPGLARSLFENPPVSAAVATAAPSMPYYPPFVPAGQGLPTWSPSPADAALMGIPAAAPLPYAFTPPPPPGAPPPPPPVVLRTPEESRQLEEKLTTDYFAFRDAAGTLPAPTGSFPSDNPLVTDYFAFRDAAAAFGAEPPQVDLTPAALDPSLFVYPTSAANWSPSREDAARMGIPVGPQAPRIAYGRGPRSVSTSTPARPEPVPAGPTPPGPSISPQTQAWPGTAESLMRPESRVGRDLLATADDLAKRTSVPLGAPAPAAAAPVGAPVLARPTNAYTIGAPGNDDMVDRFGRETPGAQSFARQAFAAADNARKLLEDYKRANPSDAAGIAAREAAANQAAQFATQANTWAAMPTSQRRQILTQGQVAADQASAIERGRSQISEMQQDPALWNTLRDFNETGILRDGAGPGTSLMPDGGVISAPDAAGTRTVTSPYGTGSSTKLTPHQAANRPEATIDGMPASQFFEDAASRQGRVFEVGGVQYGGPEGTQLAPGRTSYTPYDYKQVASRREFWDDKAKQDRAKAASLLR